jgi:hypothetical protein
LETVYVENTFPREVFSLQLLLYCSPLCIVRRYDAEVPLLIIVADEVDDRLNFSEVLNVDFRVIDDASNATMWTAHHPTRTLLDLRTFSYVNERNRGHGTDFMLRTEFLIIYLFRDEIAQRHGHTICALTFGQLIRVWQMIN